MSVEPQKLTPKIQQRAIADFDYVLVYMFEPQPGELADSESKLTAALLVLLLTSSSKSPQLPQNPRYQLSGL